jgi:hypothetical protein
MGDEATENRTFEKFISNWPAFPVHRPPRWWGYRGDAYYKRRDAEVARETEDEHAKIDHAFWVQQRTSSGMGQVRIKYRNGQNLFGYLTKWEMLHSTLFPASNKSVEPVVDENYTLVAHTGWFRASHILVPSGTGVAQLDQLLDGGVPAFVSETNPMPAHYGTAYTGAPEMKYRVLTDPEGKVLGVSGFDYGAGAESTTPPWEYIMIGKALITLVKTGTRVAVKALVRNATKQSVATGPTVRAAQKALAEAEKDAAKAEAEAARKTLRGIGIAARTPFRRLVGRLSPAEMTKYLKELLAMRPDLRRLMAVRTTKGMYRLETIKLALKEFEQTQGWKVVEKTAAEMEAVTTKNNLVTLRAQIREVWINTERANRWDPDVFYDHVVHDLSAHALAGRGGILMEDALPFVGQEFTAGVTDGLTLLERSIKEGNVDWIVRFFGR